MGGGGVARIHIGGRMDRPDIGGRVEAHEPGEAAVDQRTGDGATGIASDGATVGRGDRRRLLDEGAGRVLDENLILVRAHGVGLQEELFGDSRQANAGDGERVDDLEGQLLEGAPLDAELGQQGLGRRGLGAR